MKQTSIFIVEDESIAAASLALDLQRNNYQVVGMAASGMEALRKIPMLKPDLILMDIVLQGAMDGITVSDQIQTNYKIPIVYLTSFSDRDTLKRARSTQPQAYIVKPYNLIDLKATLESVLTKPKPVKVTLNNVTRKVKTSTNKLKAIAHNRLKLPSLSDHERNLKREKYRKRLQTLSSTDSQIVETLNREGVYLTSLAELKIPHTKRLIRELKTLQPQLYTFSHQGGWRAGIPALRKFAHPEIMYWALQERLLNIIENYIGLPLLFHGVDLRRDQGNTCITDARQWHLDIDDQRMVKIIIYLNNVGNHRGPFEYIPRSFTPQIKDALKYTTGFVSEQKMSQIISPQNWQACIAKAGTVVIIDPCNIFHRAKPAERNRYSITFGYTSRIPKISLSQFKLSSEEWNRITPNLNKRQIACLQRDRILSTIK